MFHPTPEELQRQISELQAQLAITQGKPLATNESITASQGSSLIKISGNVFGNVTLHTGTGPSPRQLLVHYLQILITDCQRLNIDNVDKKVALEASSLMRLSAVFTMPSISTFSNVRGAVTHLRGSNSLIEFVSRNSHTVLLGKPGTGKTAFSSFLCLCIAGHLTQNAEISLSLLGPLWKSGTPLPLRIKLKEYANTSMLKGLSLWDHLKKSWSGALEGFSDPVRQHLLSEGGLLVLDGLDDISEEFDLRRKLRESILAFHKQFPNVRQLITSRTYVYIDKEWQLPGFQLAEIAPFVKQQQETFIDRWHAESIRLDNPPRAGRCRKLKEVLSDHTDIEEISRNPLILTLISSW
ncbi:MAG: NACHT domain-containing protein, partial [Prosthecobacter sp.]|nr:NACHT domain-containing protein [Prosthecobacter sp.]